MSCISTIIIILMLIIPSTCYSTVIFSSKWDAGDATDGGNWYYAQPCSSNPTLTVVSGDQSSIGGGGPSSVPPGSNATNYLRINITNSGDPCLYLQTHSENADDIGTDLYMGAWWYFESGFDFRDSIKFMDFRGNLSKLSVGNGHLALFGMSHNGYYCNSTTYGTGDYTNMGTWTAPQHYHYIGAFRYLADGGTLVSSNEGNFNFYNVSPMFDSNLDINESVIPRASYGSGTTVNRISVEGGYWIAVIARAKISSTVGAYEMWMKKGSGELYKVMQWDTDTIWSSDNSTPHNMYTANGTAGINHVQFFGYMNSGTSYPSNQYVWLSNAVVATTYAEVEEYLGLSGSVTTITGITAVGATFQ